MFSSAASPGSARCAHEMPLKVAVRDIQPGIKNGADPLVAPGDEVFPFISAVVEQPSFSISWSPGYHGESNMGQLTAAALIAEQTRLGLVGRVPKFFPGDSSAEHFRLACRSADTERCPPAVLAHLGRIQGFCTGKYFSESWRVNGCSGR
jgi:hypothetical protein